MGACAIEVETALNLGMANGRKARVFYKRNDDGVVADNLPGSAQNGGARRTDGLRVSLLEDKNTFAPPSQLLTCPIRRHS